MTRVRDVTDGRGILGDERGMVILVVMILIVILSLIGLAAGRNVVTNMRIGANHVSSVKAFHAAEAAAERGFNDLFQELKRLNPNIGGLATPSVSGYTVSGANGTSFFQPVGARDMAGRVLAYGTYEGLTAYVQKYRINAQATEAANNGVGIVALEVEDQLIPIFQFGVFYGQDMEILPGANMTFTGGRIHSNQDIYLNTYSDSYTLRIDSKITSAGDIFHKRKDSASTPHPVQIKDSAGNYQSMSIDSDSANWATDSQTTWGGRVKTVDHGVKPLNVPQDSGQPIDILGTGTGSMYSKAGLRIEDGVLKNKNGTAVSGVCETVSTYQNPDSSRKIDPGCTWGANYNPVVRPASVYDYREGRSVTTYDIDVAELQTKTNAMNALADPPAGGDPGILYVTSSDTSKAIRLINGGSLPDSTHYTGGGLTVSTNNPLYVKGDYNTANRPAAILADAVTVLSNAWSDSYGSGTGISGRIATATTVKAAIMAGNVPTSGSNYSGGVENFMRFLEKWTGVTSTYAGSIVCLWQSQYATHRWPGTGTVYTAPTRDWAYGISANNLPPGTPRVRYVLRLGFRQGTN